MQNLLSTFAKKWLITALLILTLGVGVTALTQADSLAAAPSGRVDLQTASILSEEIVLTAADFAGSGQADGVAVTAAGLTLTDGWTEGSYVTDVIASPLPFTTDIVPLWGGDIPADTELLLESRLSLDGGASWSEWLANPEAFYPVRDELHSGNLIWAGSEQVALQLRVTLRSSAPGLSPRLERLILAFSDTSQGPTDGEIAGQMAGVSSTANVCPVVKPPVATRTDWGCPDGQNSPRRPPIYRPVTHIIIHQAETPNTVGPYQDWAGWVRSVWNYHANILGWGDVGYNYLIDPTGVIYEGRAGGDNVVGIHDGRNLGSMAIGFLGCYGNCDDPRLTTVEPNPEMLASAVELMAWKLDHQDIDPLSTSDYNGLSDIPVIAGGRDVSWTSSPGDNLYNRLPDLRAEAADRIECELPACQITGVIFDRESYNVGDTINVTVRLADQRGTPLVGAHVTAEITRQPVAVQAATGFGLIDRAGEYDGVYQNTNLPGLYEFNFTAADPTGERFLPCTASATVQVDGAEVTPTPTFTPTPTPTTTPETPTPTPTNTPTPTPTVEPEGAVLKVEPAQLTLCAQASSGEVNIENVAALSALQLEVSYDPAVVQVIDADPARDGVQVQVGDAFAGGFIAQNSVDSVTGRITFAATLFGGERIDGDANIIEVDWQPQAVGVAAINLEDVILVDNFGQIIDFTPQNGTIEVIADCTAITGQVALQGRADHGGIVVTSSTGEQTQTAADGSFSIASGGALTFEFPGYLSAQTGQLDAAGAAGLATVTLLAGDINGDNLINILDMAYIASKYRGVDSLADLNADGRVDILDLALAASNYQQQGPLAAGR